MQQRQQLDSGGIFRRASGGQRLAGLLVFLAIAGLFVILRLAASGIVEIGYWLGPCGFKQMYGLPCPTCGMTTAALAFVQLHLLESFYIQPAGALLCSLLVFIAFFAFFTAVFGVYFRFLERFRDLGIGWVLLAVVIVIGAGWAVTLSRALRSR